MATAADGRLLGARSANTSSFSRARSSPSAVLPSPPNPGVKVGPNGATFVSSGIPDLDRILGGGFLLGSLVMVMEDADAPHHLLLLRNFMSQGVVHRQPVLFASPLKDPRAFLGTLPSPVSLSKEHRQRDTLVDHNQQDQEKGLRIAWQYKKYFGDQQSSQIHNRDVKQEFSNDFDLRKALERQHVQYIESMSIQDIPRLTILRDRCSNFLSGLPRSDGGNLSAGRIAIQSLCAPQCGYAEMVCIIVYTEPKDSISGLGLGCLYQVSEINYSLFKCGCCGNVSHFISFACISEEMAAPGRYIVVYEDKDMAKLLTGYQDMLGLLHVHKVAHNNSQSQLQNMMDDGFPGLFKHTTNSQLTHLQSPKLLVSQECFFMGCNHSMRAMELGTKILRLLFIVSLSTSAA
ncbi:elongator complex protein [Musa troglodytarum]|uniref:Elongator complex protein 4 n=1 Tax=Musa troglodytarum TaxID=320322 RepID=A0A9E7HC61_9LILI|nr:elongator complex protein [Musa troglodytarum]